MRVLVDTNILLRWRDQNSPWHRTCVDAVDYLLKHGDEPCCCAQVLIEAWAVATRPVSSNGMGLEVVQASRLIHDARAVFSCLPEPLDMADRWERTVVRCKVLGKQAHDARLAAFMVAHGITHLITLNTADFARYPEITPLTPAEILAR